MVFFPPSKRFSVAAGIWGILFVLLSFPEWGHCVYLWLASRSVCMQLLRYVASCLPWITGELLEIPPKNHQALLMSLTSFFFSVFMLSFCQILPFIAVCPSALLHPHPCSLVPTGCEEGHVSVGKPSVCPIGNLMMASQEAHTGSGGTHSFLPPAGQVAAIAFWLWASQRSCLAGCIVCCCWVFDFLVTGGYLSAIREARD